MAIQHRSLSVEAYDALRRMILEGDAQPGEKLVEEKLTAQLGVSRTPLRQAMSELAKDGLVELIPRRGAFVAQLTERDIVEIYDVRAVLEGLATRCAAELIPKKDLWALEERFREAEMKLADNPDLAIEADIVMHELVIRHSENSRIERIAVSLRDQVHTFRVTEGRQLEAATHVMQERWDILNALMARDGLSAEQAMIRHIEGVKQRRLQQMRTAGENDTVDQHGKGNG